MKKIIYLIAVLFIFFSCQKNEYVDVNQIKNSFPIVSNVTIKEGRLVFKNRNDFNSVVQSLFENQKRVKNFEDQFVGFTSNNQAYENYSQKFMEDSDINEETIADFAFIREDNGEKCLERTIDLHLLAYLFNDKGVLQIGDSIYKYTYDFTYKFGQNKLIQLKSAKINQETDGVIAYPNVRDKFEMPENNLKSATASVDELTKYYSGTKFMKCELNRNITYLYNALTVDTKSRKKTMGIGFAYSVHQLYCAAWGKFRVRDALGNIFYENHSFDVIDIRTGGVSDVQATIYWDAFGNRPEFISGTTTGKHQITYSYGDPVKPFEYTHY
jgi:hypothetical protein